jgi:hypothetical protein
MEEENERNFIFWKIKIICCSMLNIRVQIQKVIVTHDKP